MKGELPEGWELAELKDLGPVVSGGTPKTSDPENFDGGVSWITPADLTGYHEKHISRGRRNISEKGLASSSAKLMPARSILFSSRAPIGYVAIASKELCTNQGFKSIATSEEVDESFVYFYLKSAKELAESNASGTTFKEISGSRFGALPIPVAPLNEQRRIADKIETLFARLDKGEEGLRRVQALLARYRQSVLKAAVTGRLTAGWRAENAHRLESGETLLARILETRRKTWSGRGKYKEPATPDATDLPELPEGWVWATVDIVANETVIGLVRSASLQNSSGEGVRYVKMDRVNMDGNLDTATDVRVQAEADEVAHFSLKKGDILFNTRNSLELVGKVGLVMQTPLEPTIFNNNLMRIRLVSQALPNFVNAQMSSPVFRKRMEAVKRATTSVAAIYGGDLKALPLAIPPIEEQHQICGHLSTALAQINSIASWCQTEPVRSVSLRQSILKEAFAGRLVPQDPDDEPAANLLARIKAARADAPKKRSPRKAHA